MSQMEAEKRLASYLDQESVTTHYLQHIIFSIVTHTLPFIHILVFTRYLFQNAGQRMVTHFLYLFCIQEVLCHAFPEAFALSAATNAQVQFGAGLGNISQIQLSHCFILCFFYQLIIWVAGTLLLFTNPDYVLQKLFEFSGGNMARTLDYLTIKLMTEPLLFGIAHCSLFFIVAERNSLVSVLYSFAIATAKIISVQTIFVITRHTMSQTDAIYYLGLVEFGIQLVFVCVIILLLCIKNSAIMSNVYFQVQCRFLFPVNWVTLKRIFVCSLPVFGVQSMPYISAVAVGATLTFATPNRSDHVCCQMVFVLVLAYLIHHLLLGAINATITYHAYYIGKQRLRRAQNAVFFNMWVSLFLIVVAFCPIEVTRLEIYDIFTSGSYAKLEKLLAVNDRLKVYFYFYLLLHLFSIANVYEMVAHQFWQLGVFNVLVSYAYLLTVLLNINGIDLNSLDISLVVLKQCICYGYISVITFACMLVHTSWLIQKLKWV